MFLIVRRVVEFCDNLDKNWSHPLSQYPIIRSPLSVVAIVALYLLFVYKWGPRMMMDRKPFRLQRTIIVYNVVQVLLNAYIFLESSHLFVRMYSLKCQPVDYSVTPSTLRLARVSYIYCLIKMFDFLDTVFFVLRKKSQQASFLHSYHHAAMAIVCSFLYKFVANSHFIFMGIINAFVHTVMYCYYGLAAVNPDYRKSIWWKKYITQLQMFQFGIIFLHLTSGFVSNCGLPRILLALLMIQTLFITLMFGEFYYKNYIRKRPAKALN
ncbi:elongation of very long chain fatty acids protein AAEL008004-like [Phlebotomus argentipes]|uniref:elongation of very long chain fatty acids protein AAEL008004-like n=1 Tax=Phlebotomus argentipes TaxID=94469 RepID=UPI0028929E74|nr:elongation of very long chain fatty acids protein AAEL008004-like [Phlebotomus argentipes]